mgnify:CR=1 FL=1
MKLNDIKLTESGASMDAVQRVREVKRMADHWKKAGKGMSKDQLIDGMGDDLEQLEYSPEEVEKMVPMVLKAMSS